MAQPLPVMKGTLDVLVLKALSWGGPLHGFAVAAWLEERSGGSLGVEDSALYQALQRLEERGHVSAELGVTDNNRRARYYEITGEGRRRLEAQEAEWARSSGAVNRVLRLALYPEPQGG